MIRLIPFYRHGEHAAMIEGVKAENGRIARLEKHSVKMFCSNCQREIFTGVEKKISRRGLLWAVLCFCFLSFYLSLLVLFMDVFKEFTHYCPSCSTIIGRYIPPLSGRVIALFICLIVGSIAIEILFICLYVFFVLSDDIDTFEY